jgi:hypothetical protein
MNPGNPIPLRLWILVGAVVLVLPLSAWTQTPYQRPPAKVLDVLDAPITPDVSLSPARDRLLLIDQQRYPSIAELARPMLALAGRRFDPANRGPHRPPRNTGFTLQDLAGGEPIAVSLPPWATTWGARLGPGWFPIRLCCVPGDADGAVDSRRSHGRCQSAARRAR